VIKFHLKYFILAVVLFVIEVCIALFVQDNIIRPYVGDLIVVVLIYCFIKSFFSSPVLITAISVLLFSYAIELLQYFDVVKIFGLQNSNLAKTIMGTSFEWLDILAYTIGIGLVIWLEDRKGSKIRVSLYKVGGHA
jgi:hypothetical protein